MRITLQTNRKFEIEGQAYAYRKFSKVYAPKIVEKKPSLLLRFVYMFRVRHERVA
jgi:hypothetical protein